ncbi:MAG: DUF4317 domain-containing protein [Clostridia bacterium]|nr:DUF4317 domain-containing protein [Clostridia bacterium]
MNKKEIAEIRRRLNPEKCAVRRIRGCYVNTNREIISMFSQSPNTMPEEELEKYLAIFKKTLSGTPDKNLVSLEFSTDQVREGEQHALLMELRDTGLEEDEPVEAFFQTVVDSLVMEDNYVILLMHDSYDVPRFTSDDGELEDSSTVFHYVLCSICPVRLTKPALSYHSADSAFHTRSLDWVVNAPDLGFMFPVFEDRGPNIYNTLYYMRDAETAHDEFVDTVFSAERPMAASEQKETFKMILEESLAEDCSYDIIQAVNEQITERLNEQKADKEAEPLRISRNEVKDMLRVSGVSEDRVEAFEAQYDDKFGEGTDISAVNLVETRQINLRMPDVVIKVAPNRSDLIETRVINGMKYIMIRAEEGVELNGVNLSITDESTAPF